MNQDSRLEADGLRLVHRHVGRVQYWLGQMVGNLLTRSVAHDESKYSPEEIGLVLGKPAFDKLAYMSQAERDALAAIPDALAHHYAHNSHHPEHYPDGVAGMSLMDLLELSADWKAAGEMSPAGSFAQSLEYNRERFSLSPQLVAILENTGRELGWL